jgi:hydroxypyruvate reductase
MNFSAENFLTQSLSNQSWGLEVGRIMASSISAVDPQPLISNKVQVDGSKLVIGTESIDLQQLKKIYLLSIGKAAIPMALQTAEILGKHLHKGIILTKKTNQLQNQNISEGIGLYYGGHPIPDQNSIDSTSNILEQLTALNAEDLVILLLSGGGSALFSKPYPGITLEDLQKTNQILLSSGVAIDEMNTIRKHISSVKGGQLLKYLSPSKVITLVISDVPGDRTDMIASGITVPDPTTYAESLKIINDYAMQDLLPESVLRHLESGQKGEIPETPKPGDRIFDRCSLSIIATNRDAIQGAVDQARIEGFHALVWPDSLRGEASLIGKTMVRDMLNKIDRFSRGEAKSLILSGGETTVTFKQEPAAGKGGRNLEVALGSVELLAGIKNICLITLATDGEDGITDAAGAVVTGETYQLAKKLGLNPNDYLNRHDSYHFFTPLGDVIQIGSTQTNVNDLLFLFKFQENA